MSKQKKYPKVVMEITMLTREKAQTLVDSQTDQQRKLSNAHVARYADASERGLWKFDGTPIRVDWYGRMVDGQHRCHMVIKTGKAEKVLIIYGLDPDIFQVLDSGKRRAIGDALRVLDESHYCVLASALTILAAYENGTISAGHGVGGEKYKSFQTEDALTLLKKHPDLRASVKKAMPVRIVLNLSAAAFLHYVFSKKNAPQADEFFEKLASGEGFKKKDPIGVLRDRLLFNRTEAKKMNRGCKIAITIKAWNVFRRGGTLTKLTWRGEKRPEEPMPEIA